MIKDTACENCPFKAQGFKECPNYMETLWHEHGSTQPTIVHDCAPRRSLLLLQELYGRTFALQQQISQSENQIAEQRADFTKLVNAIRYIQEQKEAQESSRNKMAEHLASMQSNKGLS